MSVDAPDVPGKSIASLLGTAPAAVLPPVRLSESPVWDRQRRFYAGDAVGIWGAGVVPHHITANAPIASTYARMVAEFLRVAPGEPDEPGELTVPHIVELGGGTGRFGYLFVRHLRELMSDEPFVYVLTDFAPDRVERWIEHPSLRPFVDDGLMDFAVLDADRLGPVELVVSGRRVAPGSLQAPVVGIANYVFDTLRHDCYTIHGGLLSEFHLSLTDDDSSFDGAEWHAVARGPIAADLEPILDYYAETLDDTVVLVPVDAMRCIDFLDSLTSAPALVLAADKGHTSPFDLCAQAAPAVVPHGEGFSVMVNFDLLARWNRAVAGGVSVLPNDPAHSLVVAALLRGGPGDVTGLARLETLFQDQLVDVGPDNYFAVRQVLIANGLGTIESLLASLRLSRFDPSLYLELLPALLAALPAVPESMKGEVHNVLVRVWRNWFPIGEPIDMALCVGLAFSAMSRWQDAIDFLELSVKEHDDSSLAAFAMASAMYGHRELRAAREWVTKALELEPGYSDARALRTMLAKELQDSGVA